MRDNIFLSTPSARRATKILDAVCRVDGISIHALREEGDPLMIITSWPPPLFLSTPSARRATMSWMLFLLPSSKFLSTPSARRATQYRHGAVRLCSDFYPRPPRGGRPVWHWQPVLQCWISIHALREEGDQLARVSVSQHNRFLSTPSARRATSVMSMPSCVEIDFYPRPPRGGRPASGLMVCESCLFLSTPSARRATVGASCARLSLLYFYPRPPRGGRRVLLTSKRPLSRYFYPRPPRGGRRAASNPLANVLDLFLSTPSARRATEDGPPW